MLPFEHDPWRGDQYRAGGIMVWGFSHHRKINEVDDAGFTARTIRCHALTEDHWFFNRIRRFFGDEGGERFWHSVAFANTLPTTVLSSCRTSPGSAEQRMHVGSRVERILRELAPGKVFLFSSKGWTLWPPLNGSSPEPAKVLMRGPELQFGTYDFGIGHEIRAYALPHPMFQRDEDMTARVRFAMSH